MRRICQGQVNSPETYACVDIKTMTNVETGEVIDRKYWMQQHLASLWNDPSTTPKNEECDVFWRKINVDVYEDFDLSNGPEESYELLCQNSTRKIFRKIRK